MTQTTNIAIVSFNYEMKHDCGLKVFSSTLTRSNHRVVVLIRKRRFGAAELWTESRSDVDSARLRFKGL